jgi:AGCS family alanine or glycine:cation symporter
MNWLEIVTQLFSWLVDSLEKILFFSLGGFPLIILWLLAGGIFFTLRLGFVSLRGFPEALRIALSKETNPHTPGELSPFQALATALSGSVGLGNIAGVAIAIHLGGAGAVFWMTVGAFLGMSLKFVECSLGIKYRSLNSHGELTGGPMYYLSIGLDKRDLPRLGEALGLIFAVFGIFAAFGGGNMFQSNQAFAMLATFLPGASNYGWLFGLVAPLLVGLVILGGINRISLVASKLVPLMVGAYLGASCWVVALNYQEILPALALIWEQAWHPEAVNGGIIGVISQGMRRSSFSHGAGMGIAAIAHAVARNSNPTREGLVAILEPFIDTVIICNLTALVILTTDTLSHHEFTTGSALANTAFQSALPWFPPLLLLIIFCFAFSTLITWSYYGERCWAYLLGESNIILYNNTFANERRKKALKVKRAFVGN